MPRSEMPTGEIIMIRHAPIAQAGRLFGRTDAPARLNDADIATLAARLPVIAAVVSSPALRCRQTAEALWPGREVPTEARLWEQDFGAHDGLPLSDLPDLGPLSSDALAQWSPPGGESFAALCVRVAPALCELAARACVETAPIAVVAHAGVIRAALSLLTTSPAAALAFEIAPLSCTRLRCGPDGPFAAIQVNA